jgi:hypothetical protein
VQLSDYCGETSSYNLTILLILSRIKIEAKKCSGLFQIKNVVGIGRFTLPLLFFGDVHK